MGRISSLHDDPGMEVSRRVQWKPFMGENRNAILANLKIGSSLVKKIHIAQS